jgi:predicted nicotinamide N-methyase
MSPSLNFPSVNINVGPRQDLPSLRTQPSSSTLLKVLTGLTLPSTTFNAPPPPPPSPSATRWLTALISSPLQWLPVDTHDEILAQAAARLSERCGRTAVGTFQRTFQIPGLDTAITLQEPALTADNLGLKTWASAYLLAKQLPSLFQKKEKSYYYDRVLELGAGTGLVGIAAAALLHHASLVVLTDLDEIVGNLSGNVERNQSMLCTRCCVDVLDWRDYDQGNGITVEDKEVEEESQDPIAGRFDLILAADPLYSPEHPRLLVNVVVAKLRRTRAARVFVGIPLRNGYQAERDDFKDRMCGAGFVVENEGDEVGWDDWAQKDGGAEVRCWWSLWMWGKMNASMD